MQREELVCFDQIYHTHNSVRNENMIFGNYTRIYFGTKKSTTTYSLARNSSTKQLFRLTLIRKLMASWTMIRQRMMD